MNHQNLDYIHNTNGSAKNLLLNMTYISSNNAIVEAMDNDIGNNGDTEELKDDQ